MWAIAVAIYFGIMLPAMRAEQYDDRHTEDGPKIVIRKVQSPSDPIPPR